LEDKFYVIVGHIGLSLVGVLILFMVPSTFVETLRIMITCGVVSLVGRGIKLGDIVFGGESKVKDIRGKIFVIFIIFGIQYEGSG